ncbi:MAG: S1 RNA-binding domain-containing protein, partial [Bdellovibrionota bacterium]
TKRVLRAEEVVKVGEKITVMIKGIDPATRRISLSLKDAGSDPWALIAQKFPVGKIAKGRVERREGYGIFVKLEDGIVGLMPKSKALEMPEYPFDKLRIGDETVVQVAEVRQEERRISLQPPKDPENDEWKNHVVTGTASLGTFGGAFGAKLKASLEKTGTNKKS